MPRGRRSDPRTRRIFVPNGPLSVASDTDNMVCCGSALLWSGIRRLRESQRVGGTPLNVSFNRKWRLAKDEKRDHCTIGWLLRRVEEKEEVKGGIIIPDTAKEKPMEGEVISVGPGKIMEDGKRSPMDVKAGDRVLFGKYAGTEIKIDDKEYVIMREEEVLAVLKGEK